MKNRWIKKGDKVVVISGNSRGIMGDVLARKGDKILVQGVNVRKCHMKRRSQEGQSGIISAERPIHISNVALCDNNGERISLSAEVREGQSRSGKILSFVDQGQKKEYRVLRKSGGVDRDGKEECPV